MPDTWNWTNYDTKSNFSRSPPHTLKANGGITYFVRFQLNAAAPPSPPLKIFLAVQQVRPGPSLILGGERGGTKFKITMNFQKVNVLDFEVPLVKAHRKYQVFAKIIKGFGKRVQFHVSTDVGKCAGSFATGLIGAARRGGWLRRRPCCSTSRICQQCFCFKRGAWFFVVRSSRSSLQPQAVLCPL